MSLNTKGNISINKISSLLKKKSKQILQFSFLALVLGIVGISSYNALNQGNKVAFAANDPIISLALSQKSGTAPFTGTCTPGGNTYTAGDDACDTDNVSGL